MSKKNYLFFFIVLVTLAACSANPYLVNQKDFRPDGGELAVIAAKPNGLTELHAFYITLGLQINSRFTVLSQKQVAEKLGTYPVNIQGPFEYVYTNIHSDYTKTDLNAIKEIQQKLGVKYLYVIWSPREFTGNFFFENRWGWVPVDNIVQVFEFPGAREVAHGIFTTHFGGGLHFSVEDAVRTNSYMAAIDLAKKTNMQKD
jgi:hypothetical protein